MPTGYTEFIEDGSITTGKDFLRLCTRNFGIAMEIREDPLNVETPTHFEPNTFYYDMYQNAIRDLDKVLEMTMESARKKMGQEHSDRVSAAIKFVEKSQLLNEQYAKIRSEIENWIPPTRDHAGIKKFALEQIDMCIVPENEISAYRKQALSVLDDSDEAVKTYIEEEIKYRRDMVDTYQRQWRKELQRTEEKNRFMDQFLRSLENV